MAAQGGPAELLLPRGPASENLLLPGDRVVEVWLIFCEAKYNFAEGKCQTFTTRGPGNEYVLLHLLIAEYKRSKFIYWLHNRSKGATR